MTTLRDAFLLLGACALFVALGYVWSHHEDAAAGQQREAHADSLVAASQRVNDSLRAHVIADSVDAAEQAARGDSLAAAGARLHVTVLAATAEASAANAALIVAQTGADSLVDYRDHIVPALNDALLGWQNLTILADSARRADSSAYAGELRATGVLDGMLRNDSTLIRQLRDSLGKPVPAPIIRGFGGKVLDGGETIALGAATVGACKQSALSVGCIAGGVATVVRLKPWKW